MSAHPVPPNRKARRMRDIRLIMREVQIVKLSRQPANATNNTSFRELMADLTGEHR